MTERKPQVFPLAEAPRRVMRFERGTMIRLVGEENGANNLDFHINIINVDSGPGPYHYHERAENAYLVLEGTVEVVVEGTRYILRKDDVGFIPPGLRHYAGNAGDIPARVIEIYAPSGTDFNIVDSPTEIVDAVQTKSSPEQS